DVKAINGPQGRLVQLPELAGDLAVPAGPHQEAHEVALEHPRLALVRDRGQAHLVQRVRIEIVVLAQLLRLLAGQATDDVRTGQLLPRATRRVGLAGGSQLRRPLRVYRHEQAAWTILGENRLGELRSRVADKRAATDRVEVD